MTQGDGFMGKHEAQDNGDYWIYVGVRTDLDSQKPDEDVTIYFLVLMKIANTVLR